MANGYVIVPNILPGNVTIGGNLIVGGDSIRIGVATPYCRVGKDASARAFVSHNLAPDTVTRDLAANKASELVFEALIGAWADTLINQNGAAQNARLHSLIGEQGTNLNITGTVAETTVYSTTIFAGLLGAHGAVHLKWMFASTVQGATASTFRIKYGGSTIVSFTLATAQIAVVDVVLWNQGAANAQRCHGVILTNGVAPATLTGTLAIDSTVDQTFAVTHQPGATTDNWTHNLVRLHDQTIAGGF